MYLYNSNLTFLSFISFFVVVKFIWGKSQRYFFVFGGDANEVNIRIKHRMYNTNGWLIQ